MIFLTSVGAWQNFNKAGLNLSSVDLVCKLGTQMNFSKSKVKQKNKKKKIGLTGWSQPFCRITFLVLWENS